MYQCGDNLSTVLATPATSAQDGAFAARPQSIASPHASPDHNSNQPSKRDDTLQSLKTTIGTHLDTLEKADRVRRVDHYQAIVTAIAFDVLHMRKYRHERNLELARIRETLAGLEKKQEYFTEQIATYDLYVQGCLQNMAPSKVK